ncbi:SUKH-4 family immunity protein [Cupriavidus alkaliphilus]|uniref:SUKH-3 immunity protein of toxin-antitoxin system n=1 Tax=Cupriavidus alkaliphilus TaxID=942866 RepID=A0A7W4VDF7_9BURK|nr:SUKH-4 family immunity protein [Cupriavidus alkaliphilus]MBB3009577.1 hypothetical protein [Cupriavidus alkaliphilus]
MNLQLDEFVVFDEASLPGLNDSAMCQLIEDGLPRHAPPFLSFSSYRAAEIENLRASGVVPEQFVPFGQNGSGDLLGIDAATNEVIYFNHDDHNRRVFINSTLGQFPECLCIYQEHLHSGKTQSSLGAIAKVDPPAAKQGTMWHAEALSD